MATPNPKGKTPHEILFHDVPMTSTNSNIVRLISNMLQSKLMKPLFCGIDQLLQ